MRALILILSALVVGLAVAIVLSVQSRSDFVTRVGPLFHVGALLPDAQAGEQAEYRETTSHRRLAWAVLQSPRLPPIVVPYKVIQRSLRDARNQPYPGGGSDVTYEHRLTEHGWFPLMAPDAPEALDRVWILQKIAPDTVAWNRQERRCWRVDLIDPALPDGQDTVIAWFDPKVPVYGLLKFKRAAETWEYQGALLP